MADRTYVYVDGESHFIRSECAWRTIHGSDVCLDRLRYIGEADGRSVLVDSKAKIFWTRRMNPGVQRAYYFTSVAGDEDAVYEIKVALRSFDLDPYVIHERSQLAKRRQDCLNNRWIIEKPKGVDIALAVCMLEDSLRAFEICHLYTSDIDFLPVIKAVRARGKQVFVHGYKDGLGSQSPLLHACDQFIDLEDMLRQDCELAP